MHRTQNLFSLFTFLTILSMTGVAFGQKATPELMFQRYRPVQRNVEYDTPEADQFAKCKVEIERVDNEAGYVVYGPAGEILRKFTDTNGDNNADLFCYYRMGLEVYRDIDSDFNQKPDQHRWMNWGGTRWGVDKNEDGHIDEWKVLSAPEAARVAIDALIYKDEQALSSVLIDADDIRKLRIQKSIGDQLLKSVANPSGQLRQLLSRTKVIHARTKWMRFDPPIPGLIPKEEGRAGTDLIVYENAMAIVENGTSHDLVSVGEMIQVGNIWKLTQLPRPLDREDAQVQIGGILMQPRSDEHAVAQADSVSEEMQELLKTLEEIDESMPNENSTPAQLVQYNRQRADIIERIIPLVDTRKQQDIWVRQLADGLAAAVQTREYPEGLKRLASLQKKVQKDKSMLGYVWYRRLLSDYTVRLEKAEDDDERTSVAEWWLEELETYADRWPESDDTADAIIQLAINLELAARLDDARTWYSRLAKDYSRTNGGIRARGALRRLDLTGKKLDLVGPSLGGRNISAAQYQGRVLLVVFWASWANQYAKDELPVILATHKKYGPSGFEVLGVNLDASAAAIKPFISKYGGQWQHIREAGGTDGKLAKEFGIVSVPTMFIVDKKGVVAGGITARNLEQAVETLLQGKPLGGSSRDKDSQKSRGSAGSARPRG